MTALLTAETRRLVSRRMTRFFPLSLAVLMVFGAMIAIYQSGDNGPDFVEDFVSGFYGVPGDNSTLILGPMGLLVPIMAFVIGASFFGADQKAGMIEHLLTWEPRRGRLLLGRLIGGTAAMMIITALLSAFLVLVLYVIAATTGTTDGAFDVWPTVLGAVLRSGLIGGLFFAIGMGLTVLTNNSIASIVGFLIFVFVIETALLRPLLPKVSRWMPMENADAFVARNGVGQGGLFGSATDGSGDLPDFHHGWIAAGALVFAWAVAICFAAAVAFNRRDID